MQAKVAELTNKQKALKSHQTPSKPQPKKKTVTPPKKAVTPPKKENKKVQSLVEKKPASAGQKVNPMDLIAQAIKHQKLTEVEAPAPVKKEETPAIVAPTTEQQSLAEDQSSLSSLLTAPTTEVKAETASPKPSSLAKKAEQPNKQDKQQLTTIQMLTQKAIQN